MQLGSTHTSTLVVAMEHTAMAVGSGDMLVFATPAMIALMENAAMTAVGNQLSGGETTVGTQINVSHIKASKIGANISAKAELIAIDGRQLTFAVKAYDGETLIG